VSRRASVERRAARAFRLKDYPRAQRHLEELLALVGENPHTLHALALCCERRGLIDQALERAQRCYAVKPQDVNNLRLLARLHIARDAPDAARGYVEKALELFAARPRAGWWTCLRERLDSTHRADLEWRRWAREFTRTPREGGAPGDDAP